MPMSNSFEFQKRILPVKFLKYDFDSAQPIRNSKGRCMEVNAGEFE